MQKMIDKVKETEVFLMTDFVQSLDEVGVKNMLGRIYGLLLAQPRPLSLTEIAHKLKVSKPSISTNMKIAVQLKLVKKVFFPESPREDYYELKIENFGMITIRGRYKLETMLDKLQKALDILNTSKEELAELSEIEKKNYTEIHNRLDSLKTAFMIYLEEYELFEKKVLNRLNELKINEL